LQGTKIRTNKPRKTHKQIMGGNIYRTFIIHLSVNKGKWVEVERVNVLF
jgi:hypothetical protein